MNPLNRLKSIITVIAISAAVFAMPIAAPTITATAQEAVSLDPRDCISYEKNNFYGAGRYTNYCSADVDVTWITASSENAHLCDVDPATAKTLLVAANGTADHGNLSEFHHCLEETGEWFFFGWRTHYVDSTLQALYKQQQSGGTNTAGGSGGDASNDVNKKDANGRTLLQKDALSGDLARVSQLIETGADLNARDDEYGGTALHFAAANNNTVVIKALRDAGADMNLQDSNSDTRCIYLPKTTIAMAM